MTDVSVIIPFDPAGDEHRDRALDYVRAWWQELAVDVIICSTLSTEETWSKGRVVDRGVEWSRDGGGDLLVIADADCVPARVGILAAIRAVQNGAAWAQPHGPVWRLSEKATAGIYAGRPVTALRPRRRSEGPPGGGCVVLTRQAYDATGGIDPRFEGWGGEDISWARALDTLAGPALRCSDPLIHLFHVSARPQFGRACAASEALAGRYYDAAGDPAAMQVLVDEFRVPSNESR